MSELVPVTLNIFFLCQLPFTTEKTNMLVFKRLHTFAFSQNIFLGNIRALHLFYYPPSPLFSLLPLFFLWNTSPHRKITNMKWMGKAPKCEWRGRGTAVSSFPGSGRSGEGKPSLDCLSPKQGTRKTGRASPLSVIHPPSLHRYLSSQHASTWQVQVRAHTELLNTHHSILTFQDVWRLNIKW